MLASKDITGNGASEEVKVFIDCFIKYAQKIPESKYLRLDEWNITATANNSTTYLSLEEIRKQWVEPTIRKNSSLFTTKSSAGIFDHYSLVYACAFRDANSIAEKTGINNESEKEKIELRKSPDDFISFREFRIFIALLCIYSLAFDAYQRLFQVPSQNPETTKQKALTTEDWLQNFHCVISCGFSAFSTLAVSYDGNDYPKALFQRMDVNKNGTIGFSDFCTFVRDTEIEAKTTIGSLIEVQRSNNTIASTIVNPSNEKDDSLKMLLENENLKNESSILRKKEKAATLQLLVEEHATHQLEKECKNNTPLHSASQPIDELLHEKIKEVEEEHQKQLNDKNIEIEMLQRQVEKLLLQNKETMIRYQAKIDFLMSEQIPQGGGQKKEWDQQKEEFDKLSELSIIRYKATEEKWKLKAEKILCEQHAKSKEIMRYQKENDISKQQVEIKNKLENMEISMATKTLEKSLSKKETESLKTVEYREQNKSLQEQRKKDDLEKEMDSKKCEEGIQKNCQQEMQGNVQKIRKHHQQVDNEKKNSSPTQQNIKMLGEDALKLKERIVNHEISKYQKENQLLKEKLEIYEHYQIIQERIEFLKLKQTVDEALRHKRVRRRCFEAKRKNYES